MQKDQGRDTRSMKNQGNMIHPEEHKNCRKRPQRNGNI